MGALSEIAGGGASPVVAMEGSKKNLREAAVQQGAGILDGDMGNRYPSLKKTVQESTTSEHERFMAATTAIMCQRVEAHTEAMRNEYGESTVTADLGKLNRRLMDVVRIFYPNQVSALITDIQPLDRQNGDIFVIKPKFSNSAAGVTAGQQVFLNLTDGTYASENLTANLGTGDGSTATFTQTLTTPVRPGQVSITAAGTAIAADDGNGNIIGTNVTGTVNYATGVLSVTLSGTVLSGSNGEALAATYAYDTEQNTAGIRQLEFGLDLVPVKAKQHPLKVSWSVTAQLAASAHLNIDVPDVLSNLAAQFIRTERDIRVINGIVASAPKFVSGGNATLAYNASTTGINYNKTQFYGEIELKLNHAESIINNAMGRGGVSWVLCGYNAAELFKNGPSFQSVPNPAPIGPVKIGTLRDGTVDVIRAPSMDTNTYVVGYKGYMPGDSATILADWIPVYYTPIFQAPELVSSRGIMSLYDLFINEPNYFAAGNVSNFGA